VLAHEEQLGGAGGKLAEALFQHLEELLRLERLLGPGLRRLAPVAGGVEERVEVLERRLAFQRLLAARLADRVDDLVLEDAGEPGAQLRAPGEALLGRERGDERFLDRVFRGLAVTELERREAQQVRPLRLDFVS
jgi:hypothetical protein